MSWELSSSGFLMTLSGYVPELIEEDFNSLVTKATDRIGVSRSDITEWCIHPGGKRILDAIGRSLHFKNEELSQSYAVLKEYGNMSSPTILFVLEKMMRQPKRNDPTVFAAAFGPGLTMETFIVSSE